MDAFDGLEEVRKGNFAFYCEQSTAGIVILERFENFEMCNLNMIELMNNNVVGVVVRKHSPLRERLLINWIRLSENGIVSRVVRHWYPERVKCNANGHFQSVTFEYVAPIFFYLIFSQLLAVFILIIEIVVSKYNRR